MRKNILLAIAAVFVLSGILSGAVVRAQISTGGEIVKQLQEGAGDQGANLPDPQDPRMIVGIMIRWALSLLGVFFVVLIIYAGFLWMSAGGNDDQISKAKSYIFNAVIGLIIILSAYSITIYVFKIGLSPFGDARSCYKDSQCGKDMKCGRLGKCVPKSYCMSGLDCPSGYGCSNNSCTKASDLGGFH